MYIYTYIYIYIQTYDTITYACTHTNLCMITSYMYMNMYVLSGYVRVDAHGAVFGRVHGGVYNVPCMRAACWMS